MAAVQNQDLRLKRHALFSQEKESFASLLRAVLGSDSHIGGSGPWEPFALFDADKRCVAGLEAAVLPLILDGVAGVAGAIRSVAVDPGWRGRGLFRRLMIEALAWCDLRTAAGPVILYTEEPALYDRFGFRELAQHGFVGRPPRSASAEAARPLDLDAAADRLLIRTLIDRRAPVSSQAALGVDADLLLSHLADESWRVAYLASAEAIIAWGEEPDTIVVADVIAPALPDLATILGALPAQALNVKVMFPPDRIGWDGTPEPEDAGLMIRGVIPAAMQRPFMFPPTAEF